MSDVVIPSVLMSIQSTMIRSVQVLSRMMKLDVDILDNQQTYVASSRNIQPGKQHQYCPILKTVQKTQQSLLIRQCQNSPQCLSCSSSICCDTQAVMMLPLQVQGKNAGVLKMSCSTDTQRAQLLSNANGFREHAESTVRVFIDKALNKKTGSVPSGLGKNEASTHPESWESLLPDISSHIQQGILLFDDKGTLKHTNKAAQKQLQISNEERALAAVTVRPFGLSTRTGRQESHYVFTVNGVETIAPAEQVNLGSYRMLVLGLARQNDDEKPDHEELKVIGQSEGIQRLLKQVRRVADSPSSVMIRGESGSGKEVFAQAIHNASRRSDKPFVAINCAAIPEQLLESELFGYVKGAFTGANQKGSEGLIRQADGGTLFLDEIGDMSLHLQAKLLRVLDRREVTPVGSTQTISVDVRVISASHQDFEKLISENLFREDLYYRLNVVPLELPPLRDREGDIDLLIDHFMATHSKALARLRPVLDTNTMTCLRNWHWPGNIRELSNMIEYLINVADPTLPVTPNLLPARMRTCLSSPKLQTAKVEIEKSHNTQQLKPETQLHSCSEEHLNLEMIERDVISQALNEFAQAHDTKQQAAKALGIGIATLYRKIKKYGLESNIVD